jgi:hypothetical protein
LVERILATKRPGLQLAAHAEASLGYLGDAGYPRVEQEMEDTCARRSPPRGGRPPSRAAAPL